MIKKTAKLGLMVGALGVVYGDIGTSPLYVMSETFFGHYDMERSPENILGVLSLIFWSLMMVVTVKYVMLIMKADNGGEGGIFALLGLFVKRSKASPAADANEAESSGKKNAAKSNSIFKKKVVIPEG